MRYLSISKIALLITLAFALSFTGLKKVSRDSQNAQPPSSSEATVSDLVNTEKCLREQGNILLNDFGIIVEHGEPSVSANGALGDSLGTVLGCADVTLNQSGLLGDSLISRCSYYTYGVYLMDKSGVYDGADVTLTLKADMQSFLYDALVNTDGQAVVINYQTGEILASVSRSKHLTLQDCFDASAFPKDENGKINYTPDVCNSVTQTRMHPGSTIKPILAAAIMEMGYSDDLNNYYFSCHSGRQDLNGQYHMECYHGGEHGTISLTRALQKSCNKFLLAFALEQSISAEDVRNLMENWGMNKKAFYADMQQASPTFCEDTLESYALSFIGQGDNLQTLLSLSSVYCAIANHGNLVLPHYIASYSEGDDTHFLPVDTTTLMSAETADTISEILAGTILYGTGKQIGTDLDSRFRLRCKTGTADYNKGVTHKLCICYSNCPDTPYLIAVDIPEAQGQATTIVKNFWTHLL